jgi:hypothetical protein
MQLTEIRKSRKRISPTNVETKAPFKEFIVSNGPKILKSHDEYQVFIRKVLKVDDVGSGERAFRYHKKGHSKRAVDMSEKMSTSVKTLLNTWFCDVSPPHLFILQDFSNLILTKHICLPNLSGSISFIHIRPAIRNKQSCSKRVLHQSKYQIGL